MAKCIKLLITLAFFVILSTVLAINTSAASGGIWDEVCPVHGESGHSFAPVNKWTETGGPSINYCSYTYEHCDFICDCGRSLGPGGSLIASVSHKTPTVSIQTPGSYSGYCHIITTTYSNCCGYSYTSYDSHSFTQTSKTAISKSEGYCNGYRIYERCSNCSASGSYISGRSHTFGSYSSWSNYSSTQHRRSHTCSYCKYVEYSYGNHSFKYGSWTTNGNTQHKRSKSCSTCNYSTTEYANHTFKYTQIPGNYDNHYWSCSVCGDNNNLQAHVDNNGDNYCDLCKMLLRQIVIKDANYVGDVAGLDTLQIKVNYTEVASNASACKIYSNNSTDGAYYISEQLSLYGNSESGGVKTAYVDFEIPYELRNGDLELYIYLIDTSDGFESNKKLIEYSDENSDRNYLDIATPQISITSIYDSNGEYPGLMNTSISNTSLIDVESTLNYIGIKEWENRYIKVNDGNNLTFGNTIVGKDDNAGVYTEPIIASDKLTIEFEVKDLSLYEVVNNVNSNMYITDGIWEVDLDHELDFTTSSDGSDLIIGKFVIDAKESEIESNNDTEREIVIEFTDIYGRKQTVRIPVIFISEKPTIEISTVENGNYLDVTPNIVTSDYSDLNKLLVWIEVIDKDTQEKRYYPYSFDINDLSTVRIDKSGYNQNSVLNVYAIAVDSLGNYSEITTNEVIGQYTETSGELKDLSLIGSCSNSLKIDNEAPVLNTVDFINYNSILEDSSGSEKYYYDSSRIEFKLNISDYLSVNKISVEIKDSMYDNTITLDKLCESDCNNGLNLITATWDINMEYNSDSVDSNDKKINIVSVTVTDGDGNLKKYMADEIVNSNGVSLDDIEIIRDYTPPVIEKVRISEVAPVGSLDYATDTRVNVEIKAHDKEQQIDGETPYLISSGIKDIQIRWASTYGENTTNESTEWTEWKSIDEFGADIYNKGLKEYDDTIVIDPGDRKGYFHVEVKVVDMCGNWNDESDMESIKNNPDNNLPLQRDATPPEITYNGTETSGFNVWTDSSIYLDVNIKENESALRSVMIAVVPENKVPEDDSDAWVEMLDFGGWGASGSIPEDEMIQEYTYRITTTSTKVHFEDGQNYVFVKAMDVALNSDSYGPEGKEYRMLYNEPITINSITITDTLPHIDTIGITSYRDSLYDSFGAQAYIAKPGTKTAHTVTTYSDVNTYDSISVGYEFYELTSDGGNLVKTGEILKSSISAIQINDGSYEDVMDFIGDTWRVPDGVYAVKFTVYDNKETIPRVLGVDGYEITGDSAELIFLIKEGKPIEPVITKTSTSGIKCVFTIEDYSNVPEILDLYERKIIIENLSDGTVTETVIDHNVETLTPTESCKVTLQITDFNGNVAKTQTTINIRVTESGDGSGGDESGGDGSGEAGGSTGALDDISGTIVETNGTINIIIGNRDKSDKESVDIIDNPFEFMS